VSSSFCDRIDKPRVGIILKVLYKILTKRLARMVSNSRVCDKQQDSCSNKDIAFYSNLWKRIKNGADIRRKGKIKKAIEFAERMKRV